MLGTFDEASTSPLCNITMMFDTGIVMTWPNQNIAVISCLGIIFTSARLPNDKLNDKLYKSIQRYVTLSLYHQQNPNCPGKKRCNMRLCDVISWLVPDLPTESCGFFVLWDEVYTTPLYNITTMFYMGVVTTSPNQNVTVMPCLVLFYTILKCHTFRPQQPSWGSSFIITRLKCDQ